eukprot:scaffold266_cov248-Pinguiococcus_pyrenoidosus.AAC.10
MRSSSRPAACAAIRKSTAPYASEPESAGEPTGEPAGERAGEPAGDFACRRDGLPRSSTADNASLFRWGLALAARSRTCSIAAGSASCALCRASAASLARASLSRSARRASTSPLACGGSFLSPSSRVALVSAGLATASARLSSPRDATEGFAADFTAARPGASSALRPIAHSGLDCLCCSSGRTDSPWRGCMEGECTFRWWASCSEAFCTTVADTPPALPDVQPILVRSSASCSRSRGYACLRPGRGICVSVADFRLGFRAVCSDPRFAAFPTVVARFATVLPCAKPGLLTPAAATSLRYSRLENLRVDLLGDPADSSHIQFLQRFGGARQQLRPQLVKESSRAVAQVSNFLVPAIGAASDRQVVSPERDEEIHGPCRLGRIRQVLRPCHRKPSKGLPLQLAMHLHQRPHQLQLVDADVVP